MLRKEYFEQRSAHPLLCLCLLDSFLAESPGCKEPSARATTLQRCVPLPVRSLAGPIRPPKVSCHGFLEIMHVCFFLYTKCTHDAEADQNYGLDGKQVPPGKNGLNSRQTSYAGVRRCIMCRLKVARPSIEQRNYEISATTGSSCCALHCGLDNFPPLSRIQNSREITACDWAV